MTGKQAETQIIHRKANPEKTNKKEMNNGGMNRQWIQNQSLLARGIEGMNRLVKRQICNKICGI